MRRVRILETAAREALEAAAWYERQREGLGTEFDAAVQAALDVLEIDVVPLPVMPGTAGERGAKRLVLRRFPFDIVVVERKGDPCRRRIRAPSATSRVLTANLTLLFSGAPASGASAATPC